MGERIDAAKDLNWAWTQLGYDFFKKLYQRLRHISNVTKNTEGERRNEA